MLHKIRDIRDKNAFLPSGIFGLALSQIYLIRRGLAEAVKERATSMNGTILDFGCGSRPYEHIFSAQQYIGLDIEVSGHPQEGKKPDVYYDGETIPLENNSIDHVFSAEVFEHVFNAPELFKEIHRVLRPEGTLFFTCPFVWPLHEEPFDYARYTPYALESLLIEAGYKDIQIQKMGHPVEAIFQLLLMYSIYYMIPNIPLLGGTLRAIFCFALNGSARVLAKILPNDGTLYLSNIVTASKPTAL